MRKLPEPSKRPLGEGVFRFVEAAKGDDVQDGSVAKPWKSLKHAIGQLKAGDTLVLRGGVYYETLTLKLAGTKEKPIVIRSHPGEIAVLDGGLREFAEEPAKAWEPVENGEYRSAKAYPQLSGIVLGHFLDSMVPLHGYRHAIDLRSDNVYWNLTGKLNEKESFYCGPGLWHDAVTGRLHVRLAHTKLPVLGDDNYRGETDPRKMSLSVAGMQVPLTIDGARYVKLQDLVIRGGSRATVQMSNAEDIELDGVANYGGSPALMMQDCSRVRILHSALRGISAPWSSRAGHKYRGPSSYVFVSRAEQGPNRDVEIAHSELTDCHDGPYLGTIKGLRFHHNVVDNFNDDGIYLTAAGVGGDVHIYENYISRCLHAFSYHGNYPAGSGVWAYRNVIDLRRPVAYFWPAKENDPQFPKPKEGEAQRWPWTGRVCGDHGSPIWEPLHFYHNTVITRDAAFRDYYGAGWGGHVNSQHKVFNNLFVQLEGNPGLQFSTTDDKLLEVDGNMHWGLRDGPAFKGDFFAAFRQSPRFTASKKHYAPGWTAHDRFADPRLKRISSDWRIALDPRLSEGSPAIDNGVSLPEAWPDSRRGQDKGKPDMGAVPLGGEWKLGR